MKRILWSLAIAFAFLICPLDLTPGQSTFPLSFVGAAGAQDVFGTSAHITGPVFMNSLNGPVITNAAGTAKSSQRMVIDTCTASAGTCTITFTVAWTSTATYRCFTSDETTGSNVVKPTYTSTTVLTLATEASSSDVLDALCVGN